MAYSDIQAIQTCVMAMCHDDCLSRADMQQWSDAICSAAAPMSSDAGGGHASGGSAGHASGGAGGSSSGGGSSCDVGGGRWSWLALAGMLALLGAGLRRRKKPTN
jgi:uncharacterized membrane protein YgcG